MSLENPISENPESIRDALPATQAAPEALSAPLEPVSLVLPEPRPPHPNLLWAIVWCVGFMIVTQLLAGILAGVFVVFYDLIKSGNAQTWLEQLRSSEGSKLLQQEMLAPALFTSQIFVISFSLLVLRFMVGKGWAGQIGLRLPAFKHLILALVGLPALSILGGAVGELAKKHVPGLHDWGLDVESQVKQMATLPLWFLILMIGVGPGIGEELWFRGFLGRGLVGNYGVLVGVVLTSFFFGAMHVDPPQAIGAAVLGLGLHLVYLATRSILVPMLLHFLNNSLAVVALTFPDSHLDAVEELPQATGDLYRVLLYLAAAAVLVSVGWALYRSRARLVPGLGATHPWFPRYPGVQGPPEGSELVVFRPGPGWPAVWLVVASFASLVAVFWITSQAAAQP